MSAILQTSDLKKRAGKILDAAKRRPQFVVRSGHLFKIMIADQEIQLQNPPPGYFADAYPLHAERQALEAATTRLPQIPEQ